MRIQQVFGCGVNAQTFRASLEGLPEEDRLRLERVARRAWLTLKLRYGMAFTRNPFPLGNEESDLLDVELPSIEIYLLCTCLDTLAGRSGEVEFGEWLENQEDKVDLDVQEVQCLYRRYKKEHGIGSNLRNLFETLPQDAKNWLANNVVIRRSNEPLSVTNQDVAKLVKQLYTYFYEVWRNAFTHGSVSQQTLTAEDIRESIDGDSWWVTPASCTGFILYKKKENQKWNLSYRQGLDLATILRVIIGVAVLKTMGIETSQEQINAMLRHLSRLNGLYRFVSEVNSNSTTISVWSRLDERGLSTFRSYLANVGIPPLKTEATTIMIDRYENNPLESGLRQMTIQYLSEVNHLNSAVSEFNESNPPSKSNLVERSQIIKEFLEGLAKTPTYNVVLNWRSKVEMNNLWIVIRDPCYT
jgi:hypothetical protein